MQPVDLRLARYAKFLVGYTVLLILVGAMVTTLGVGLAVPDWPTTFGYNMLTYPISRWTGGVFWEHSHRVVATALGVFIIALAVWVTLKDSRRWVKAMAWLTLFVVCVQGVMGGMRVTQISIAWAVVHGCTAQLFFCLTVLMAAVLSPRWNQAPAPGLRLDRLRSISFWAWMATGAVFLQLLLGALMRHNGAGLAIQTFPLNPDGSFFPTVAALGDFKVLVHFSHRLWAIFVSAAIIVLAVKIFRSAWQEGRLRRPAIGLLVMVALQITMGGMSVWYLRASIPTSGHVINGALILCVCFLLGVRATHFARLAERGSKEESARGRRAAVTISEGGAV